MSQQLDGQDDLYASCDVVFHGAEAACVKQQGHKGPHKAYGASGFSVTWTTKPLSPEHKGTDS